MSPGKIFISYRREDTSGESGRLKDKLEQVFGQENIFYDVETLEAGLNFDQSIAKALNESKVLLAMIGPHWLRVEDSKGVKRIHKPDDWVRKEIAEALKQNLRVIPVLVNGAEMPDSEELPEDLKELSLKHAQELTSSRWNYDVGELTKVLEKIIAKRPEPKPEPSPRPDPRPFVPPVPKPISWWAKNYLWVLGGVVGFFILIGLMAPSEEVNQNYDDEPIAAYQDPTQTQAETQNYPSADDPSRNLSGSADPRTTNPSGTEIYNSLTLEDKIPDFSGKWWLYENGIRSGYFQFSQSGSEFAFTYYLFDVPVGSGTGYYEDKGIVSETFIMNDAPGNYGFAFLTEDAGKTWIGQTFANQMTSQSHLVKNQP